MVNKTPLASWLYSNKKELNPQFVEFEWPKRIFPSLFDFSVKVEWQGIKGEGRGVDIIREVALEKSIAEAIERLVCHRFNHNSIGMAVSGSFNPAENAKNESYERYFLVQHLKNTWPFQPINIETELIKKFIDFNPASNISFYKMLTPDNLHGIVCSLLIPQTKTRVLGFALTDTIERSADKSFLEAIPNYAWISENNHGFSIKHLPWHLREDFLINMEPLLNRNFVAWDKNIDALPVLNKIIIPLDEIPILKNPIIKIARYTVNEEVLHA